LRSLVGPAVVAAAAAAAAVVPAAAAAVASIAATAAAIAATAAVPADVYRQHSEVISTVEDYAIQNTAFQGV
jgi:hypothetical protein